MPWFDKAPKSAKFESCPIVLLQYLMIIVCEWFAPYAVEFPRGLHALKRVAVSRVKDKLSPPFLVNRVAPISVSLAFGPHSCASTVDATVGVGHVVTLCVSLPCSFPKC